MSKQYNDYLDEHKKNVLKAYNWLYENIPELTIYMNGRDVYDHDISKYDLCEYIPYDNYFHLNKDSRSYQVVEEFKQAWLHHIHKNPHHWQYWVLVNDEAEEGVEALDMPMTLIIEMVCDWWSFSFKDGNLEEIFDWYDKHKSTMILSPITRMHVEKILKNIKRKVGGDR